jgi:hypothetical protein
MQPWLLKEDAIVLLCEKLQSQFSKHGHEDGEKND